MPIDIDQIPNDERLSEVEVPSDLGRVVFTWRATGITPQVLNNLKGGDPLWLGAGLEAVLIGWDLVASNGPVATTQPAINLVPSQILAAVAGQIIAEVDADPSLIPVPPTPETVVAEVPTDAPPPQAPVGTTGSPIRMPDGTWVSADDVNERVGATPEE